jgi:DNA (cytosine-5)-methyltransferase 1
MGRKGEPNGRGIISIDEVCPTIARNTREKPGESYIPHPEDSADLEDTHILTLDQVARIQGFPPTYDFQKKKKKHARGPGSGWTEKQIQLMIANAVPAPMAHAIGKAIFERQYGFSMPKLDKAFTPWLLANSKKNSPKDKAMSVSAANNIRSHLRKAREMVGCRMYANLALEIQALEASSEIIWIDKKTRRRESGKRYADMSICQRSDLRTALELYHAYVLETRDASKWAPPKPKKVAMPDFKNPPKPSKWRRKPPIVSDVEAPKRVPQPIMWPAPYSGSQTDPELAHLGSLLVEDFEPPHDRFEPSPSRDDDWYPDYDPKADYEEELQERLRMQADD